MARVVQRSAPPYLAITFVFLFFIAAILAGWFYTQSRNYSEQFNQTKTTLDSLARGTEINDPKMADHKQRARANGLSAIGQYRKDQEEFVKAMTGNPDTAPDEALKLAQQLTQKSEGLGMFAYAQQLEEAAAKMAMMLAGAQAKYDQLSNSTQADATAASQAAQQLEQELAAAKAQATTAQAGVEQISEDYSSQIAKANQQWSQSNEQLKSQLADRDSEIQTLQQKIRGMEEEIRRLSNPEGQQVNTDATMAADGSVVTVSNNMEVVFIDIGKMHNVRIGLPFTVYSQKTGVVPESNGKARIIVKNTFERTAECQVLRSDPADPISVGDPIANVAYNVHSSPTFVVAGNFDLNRDGRPDRDGNEVVKAMIQRFGGTIVDDVSVDVDYVVMGMEPTRLPRPAADAPASEIELWNQNEKDIENYKAVLKKCVDYSKPVLNTSRFLTFIGYTPGVGG